MTVIKGNRKVSIFQKYQKINYQNVKNRSAQVEATMDKMEINFALVVCYVKIKETKLANSEFFNLLKIFIISQTYI